MNGATYTSTITNVLSSSKVHPKCFPYEKNGRKLSSDMAEGLSSFPFNRLCATSLADPFLAFTATQVPGCLPWRGNPLYHLVTSRISLGVHWWFSGKDLLPKETQVPPMVQQDSTCCRATKPRHHNYWASALEPTCHNYSRPRATTTHAHVPQLLKPTCPGDPALQQENPPQWEARTPQLESPLLAVTSEKPAQQWQSRTAQNK